MAKQLSGITKVSYASTVGGATTDITGKVGAESTVEVPNTITETTTGQTFGGGQITAEIIFLDMADYSTVEGFMTGDTEKSFTFTFADGQTLETQELVQPMVERIINPNARDGVQGWRLTFEFFNDGVMLA